MRDRGGVGHGGVVASWRGGGGSDRDPPPLGSGIKRDCGALVDGLERPRAARSRSIVLKLRQTAEHSI